MENNKVLVTGRFWIGADGARTIGPALVEMIDDANQEITIVAYRLTIAHDEFRKSLESALARGCLVKIILDNGGDGNRAEILYLGKLLNQYSNLTIWDFQDDAKDRNIALHAKLIAVDRKKAVVGSANFSRNGLLENHELALYVTGRTARSICIATDSLIQEASRAGALKKRATT